MTAVTLITPTGSRPEAFKLCEKFIARQTYKNSIQWIVVDDGPIPTECTMHQEYIRGPKIWREGINTQRPNMEAAYEKIRGEYILIIEDDDWYDPCYIERMVDLLEFYPVVGEGNAKYYHLPSQSYKEMHNYSHASLCQTGLRYSHRTLLDDAVNSGQLYFDVELWGKVREAKVPSHLFLHENLCVGLKGLPGRAGIGVGHRPQGYTPDVGFKYLNELIGSDTMLYKPYFTKQSIAKAQSK